ncbi:protein translocase subunit SecD [Cellulomonas fimi]|uniref:Protein translocase subunit SecD n=1 Tax=Cellulomonas fimi (strain ATCC 484 / DSM 20113 / JCM 1341 / CCUG 24087 / LMG 16345 / NBRC 15513 / NCIMB 8980 / NCTC 7547 / NRS-133) TaxID=590998 RepID=F4H0B0_CELFA|nr:protein translocase subunit SecD [Cellulomonas fimi]AEE46157.1 protein-export membrane protein SecD [Cellulomonas fimi ATCC 484]
MAPPARRHRPVRTLLWLGLLVVALFGTIFAGTERSTATWTPNLALDLEGGTQVILKPVSDDPGAITSETISQAIEVIRQRVDSSGVAEAEITSQSGNNIVVALPGTPSEETLELVRTSAQMEFRPVLTFGAPTPVGEDDAAAPEPTESAAATDPEAADPAATQEPAADAAATPEPTPSASAPASDTPAKAAPDTPSDAAYYVTPAVQERFDTLDCTDPSNLTGGAPGDPDAAFVTCDPAGTAKYILGPVEIEGGEISGASSGLRQTQTGGVTNEWVVNLEFTSKGTTQFTDVTTRLQGLTSPQNQFAVVLDGLVISAPGLDPGTIISNGKAEISGTFTRESAATLANQLNFGSLPLTFEVQSEEQISATLGSEQLQKGLVAGLIGLVLVVIYSLFQYRALGLLTVSSLIVAAVITYGVITLLSWTQGYRLSLPGVAGLIVAIGITADSFIVYFERIRDELREGRTLQAAVERGWERARRTILASDAVNFIAAAVLYVLAVGGVRGFAFTLGLTTIIDVIVVFLFTHPVMTLIARTKFWGEGHPWSGLDPRRLGVDVPRYAGRGRVVAPTPGKTAKGDADRVPVGVGTGTSGDATAPTGGTIAERRAAARAAAAREAQGAPPPEPADRGPDPTGTNEPATGRTEGSEL